MGLFKMYVLLHFVFVILLANLIDCSAIDPNRVQVIQSDSEIERSVSLSNKIESDEASLRSILEYDDETCLLNAAAHIQCAPMV